MTVRGHLDAISEPSCEIVHEVVSGLGIPVADVPARDKFGFRINRRPRPDIATTVTLFLCGNVRFLGSYEAPNFVALDTLAIQVAETAAGFLATSSLTLVPVVRATILAAI